ncbi:MAG: winged helix-turn-helix transcriptional regulator [Candidatus Dormibacteraceae bacterium]
MAAQVKNARFGNGAAHRRANPVAGCPLTAALSAMGGKWKLILVFHLSRAPRHFAALREGCPGISPKVLAEQLRELANDGIVDRREIGEVPAPVFYSLTPYGRSLLPIVESVRQWGHGHLERERGRSG